tara:strand:+ start:231 stop:410 length:180 start_codon:yes stop_codon:yes gene_type:complete
MKVKHKITGMEYEVSEDYFERNVDTLQVLEKMPSETPKRTKKTKVVTPDTEVSVETPAE